MEIVAHRGLHGALPENSLAAFEAAIDAGADFVEFDVRLTRDGVPIVVHSLECGDALEGVDGYLFEHDAHELTAARLKGSPPGQSLHISTLAETLQALAGRVGLEIEIKDPSAALAAQVAEALGPHHAHWDSIEVTSFEPAVLLAFGAAIQGEVAANLLFPRSEPWMTKSIVAYLAAGKARLAGARAVHLGPSQLDATVVRNLRDAGLQVHSYEVNDEATFALMSDLGITRFSTDDVPRLVAIRGSRARDS